MNINTNKHTLHCIHPHTYCHTINEHDINDRNNTYDNTHINTNINTHTHTHYNNNSNSTYNITYNTPTTQNYITSLNKISTHDNNNNLIFTDLNRKRKILSHTSTIRTCAQTKTDEHNNRIPQHTMSTTQQLQCHIPQQQF